MTETSPSLTREDVDAPPPATPVGDDVPCFRCGYNVRGLPDDGRCPECAAPVDESVRRHRVALAGRPLPLEASDARWVRRLAWADRLIVLGAIGVLVGEVLSKVAPSAPRVLLMLIFLVPYLAFAAGAWLGAAREPVFAARRRGRWLRVLIRAAVAGWAFSLGAMLAAVIALDWGGIYQWRTALVVAAAVLSWAFFWRQRELADATNGASRTTAGNRRFACRHATFAPAAAQTPKPTAPDPAPVGAGPRACPRRLRNERGQARGPAPTAFHATAVAARPSDCAVTRPTRDVTIPT